MDPNIVNGLKCVNLLKKKQLNFVNINSILKNLLKIFLPSLTITALFKMVFMTIHRMENKIGLWQENCYFYGSKKSLVIYMHVYCIVRLPMSFYKVGVLFYLVFDILSISNRRAVIIEAVFL